MNLKSEILKLSIIFMLVLVLIPVATAMDSNDTFVEEYDCSEDEGFVIEYDDIDVDDTQSEASSKQSESFDDHVENNVQESYSYNNHQNPVACEVEDAAIVEYIDYSVEVTHDIEDSCDVVEEVSDFTPQGLEEISHNIDEINDEDLTFEKISVNIQGSFFISKSDISVNYRLINGMLFNGIDALTSSMDRNIVKVLELKNNLLINQDLTSAFDCHKVTNLDYVLLVSINKITNDFAYSIDNSIVGSDDALSFYSCFLDVYPCFDAVFCCDFFVDVFFCGDCLIAAGVFCVPCFVDYTDQYIINYNDYNLFNRLESVNDFSWLGIGF